MERFRQMSMQASETDMREYWGNDADVVVELEAGRLGGTDHSVMNVVIKCHTAHIMLPRIRDFFLGCFLDSTDVLYVVLIPQ